MLTLAGGLCEDHLVLICHILTFFRPRITHNNLEKTDSKNNVLKF